MASELRSLRRGVILVAMGLALFGLAMFLRSSNSPVRAMRGPHSFSQLLEFFTIAILITFAWWLVMRWVYRFIGRLQKRAESNSSFPTEKA